MKISSKEFRVREGDNVNLKKWPTSTKLVYKSKDQHGLLLVPKTRTYRNWVFISNSIELRYPSVECRRFGLYNEV